jgi:hypothetical protein
MRGIVKKQSNRAKPTSRIANARPATPPPKTVPEPSRPRSVEEMFAGPRPASFASGLEPAFLLIEREVMERLRVKAAALGMVGYDSLVKRILREHIDEY